MKVNELKHKPLEEGFIDNLISKVKTMAGGDGLTGIVRSLSGQGAALNKLADQIARETEAPLIRAMGNSADTARRSNEDMQLTPVVQLGLKAALKFSMADGDPVTGNEILELLRTKKDAVQATGHSAHAGQVIDAIVKYAATKDAGTVPGLGFDAAIKEVSLVLAGAIVLVQLNKSLAEPDGATAERNSPEIQKFKQLGEKVQETLFDPTSPLLRALKPNDSFKDNLHWLVITLTKKVQNEYGNMPADRLLAAASNPPVLLTPMQYKSALAGHDSTVDPTTVDSIISAVSPIIQEQFKTWLGIAAEEAKAGKGIEESEMDYGDWARESMSMIDRLNFAPVKPEKKKAPTSTPEEPTIQVGGEPVSKDDPAYPALLAAYKKAHPEA
ncbi:hypothetical protein UFOVP71_76 [uncultured Caudovirales phage]|uniref:Uncharacterized protein n=1 Tax=uncultured Caudovirales phage TaxID=2100421 RepID=A0A6J5T9C1_9CAUD|nr:hypothetical protein UFOVP71_76 [uncultured Caudovirales phage]